MNEPRKARVPKVWHIHDPLRPVELVLVARPSLWAMPLLTVARRGMTYGQLLAAYRDHVLNDPWLSAQLPHLRGWDLACFCAPRPCHGDVLLELANA